MRSRAKRNKGKRTDLPFDIPPVETGDWGGEWAWLVVHYPLSFEHGVAEQVGQEFPAEGTAKTRKGAEKRALSAVRRLFAPYPFFFAPVPVSSRAQPGTYAFMGKGLSSAAEVQRREAYAKAVTPLHMQFLADVLGVKPEPPTYFDLWRAAPMHALNVMQYPFTPEVEQAYEQQVLVPARTQVPQPTWGSIVRGDPFERVRVEVYVTPDT